MHKHFQIFGRAVISMVAVSFAAISITGMAQTQTMAHSTPLPGHQGNDITPLARTQDKQPVEGTYTELPNDHATGTLMAPVTMIIYASVMCPHCASWFNSIWPDFKKAYIKTGKVRVVFREFPTAPTNIAAIGFQIAHCAPQDKYMDMIELQFAEQDNIFEELKAGRGKEKYLEIAKQAGLDTEAEMSACLADQKGIAHINQSIKLAMSAGINSVPHFIINEEIYEGDPNLLPLGKYIDGLIAGGHSTPLPGRKPSTANP